MTTDNHDNIAQDIEDLIVTLTERMNACADKEGRTYAALVCAIASYKRALRAEDEIARNRLIARAVSYTSEAF